MKLPLVGLALALLLPGCFRVEVRAPHGPPVRLLSREEATDIARTRRTWYAVVGAAAVDQVMPEDIIAREDLREVRVRVTDTIPDALIALFNTICLNIGVFAQTYEVHGNRDGEDRP